jgi:predicted nucleic acid-binding Zn ribbon protein
MPIEGIQFYSINWNFIYLFIYQSVNGNIPIDKTKSQISTMCKNVVEIKKKRYMYMILLHFQISTIVAKIVFIFIF